MSMPRNQDYLGELGDLLIATLGSYGSTKIYKDILFERKFKRYKSSSIRVALSRLKARGYVGNKDGWILTKRGRSLLKQRRLLDFIPSPFPNNNTREIIVSFDIPEKDRKVRNWLRNQLKVFNYTMLQQSLWIGPGPLPDIFYKRLQDLNIRKHIKTFKIKALR